VNLELRSSILQRIETFPEVHGLADWLLADWAFKTSTFPLIIPILYRALTRRTLTRKTASSPHLVHVKQEQIHSIEAILHNRSQTNETLRKGTGSPPFLTLRNRVFIHSLVIIVRTITRSQSELTFHTTDLADRMTLVMLGLQRVIVLHILSRILLLVAVSSSSMS